MKKLILILTLIFTTSLHSQYNLVFNRVVNEQLNENNQIVTVPDGKVWKIQGFFNMGNNETNNPDAYPFSIRKPDGTYLAYEYFRSNAFSNQTIWASEGDQITMAGSLPNSANKIALNALEFNLSSATSSGGGGSGDSGSGSSGSGSGSGSSGGFTGFDNTGVPGDDFTDLDGNTYGTTIINGMTWITSNYEGSTYADGTPIPYISDWNEWISATTGAYTYWIQDESLGYGKIYNLFAIRGRHDDDPNTPNKEFAPDGWHVATFDEFDYILELYSTGGSTYNSTGQYALKSQTGWIEGTNGTNISGLDIKPYGAIVNNDENQGFTSNNSTDPYSVIGGYTYFWYSTPYYANPLRANSAAYITIDNVYDASVGFSYTPFFNGTFGNGSDNSQLNSGLYVRLVKDY